MSLHPKIRADGLQARNYDGGWWIRAAPLASIALAGVSFYGASPAQALPGRIGGS